MTPQGSITAAELGEGGKSRRWKRPNPTSPTSFLFYRQEENTPRHFRCHSSGAFSVKGLAGNCQELQQLWQELRKTFGELRSSDGIESEPVWEEEMAEDMGEVRH